MGNPEDTRNVVVMDKALAGPLFMLSAALLFTALNLLIKTMGPDYRVWDIGFYRFAGGIVVLNLVFGRRKNLYKGNNIRLLIIRGCTGSVAFISLVTAIRLLPVSTALVIFYSFPAFSAVFSYLLYGETIGRTGIGCLVAVFSGTAILFDFHLAGSLTGQIMAITASAAAGLTVTLIKTLRKNNGPVIIYLYFCTMGALVTAPAFLMAPVLPDTIAEGVMVLGIIFSSITAQLLMNQGFFYCTGWEGGVFMSSEVIFTAVAGIVFLQDPSDWRFWAGGALIMGSVLVLNRSRT